MYDIIIIGAGPAGLTAAVYARRAEKTVLILEKETFGGQITASPKVENYPGEIQISGSELGAKFVDQALGLGAEIELDEVIQIENCDGFKRVIGKDASYEGKSVIIAAGSKHRSLGISKEEELVGCGISYCAVCDGAFYAGKEVAVIGGGNTALQDAVMLSELCKKVTLVQNLSFFTGEQKLLDLLKTKDNVHFIVDSVVASLHGENELEAITIKNTVSNVETRISLDGIFVAIGQQPENKPFQGVARLDDYGYIIADESCQGSFDGIFVAGDCRTKKIRQVATAISDGAIAAVAAIDYVRNI